MPTGGIARSTGFPAPKEGRDGRHFFVGQAGQRRTLPRDTGFGADVDQHFAVEVQLFC
jgi:hypothetical protein